MKLKYIGIGTDGKEYTDEAMMCDGGCIQEYKEVPSDEQIEADLQRCLVTLQFDLPIGVKFVKARYKIIGLLR